MACCGSVVDLAILLDDLPNAERHAQRIRDLEHEGDDLTHQIIALVNTTFVTPFDRKDMHRLASCLDDVIDCVEGLADLLVLLRIAKPLPQFVQQIEVLAPGDDGGRPGGSRTPFVAPARGRADRDQTG